MNRVFISVGPVSIYWYSVLVLVAVIVGYNIIVNYSKKISYHTGLIVDMMLWLVIWSIVGARIYYVVFNFGMYESNLVDILMIWKGGLAIYGAILSGALYILYYSLRHKLNFVKVLDIFSLSLLLGQAIGRWGNFFNQEAYGGKTTLAALQDLHLPKFIIDGMYIDGVYRQPTFLYESIWCLIGVVILYRIRRKSYQKTGEQLCFYLIWYGIGRFFIEGLRSDSLYLGNIRISQMMSGIFVVIGLVGIVIINKERFFERRKTIGNDDGRI